MCYSLLWLSTLFVSYRNSAFVQKKNYFKLLITNSYSLETLADQLEHLSYPRNIIANLNL